jgi:hypothetical protein
VADSSEHVNELSGSIKKGEEFLGCLSKGLLASRDGLHSIELVELNDLC